MGYIMTDPRSKADKDAGLLSETAKGHMADIFVRIRYNRQTDISNKYTLKGQMVEEDSLTLYSRYKKTFYVKNEEQLSNDFITGTPDVIHETPQGKHVIDVKSSWDIFTFMRNDAADVNKRYFWQLQGYMALTGAKSSTLAYCLVDTPEILINDEKRRLYYKMNVATEENLDYQEACEALQKSMIFGDIAMSERVIEITVDRDDKAIEALQKKVIKCREYMTERWGNLPNDYLALAYGLK